LILGGLFSQNLIPAGDHPNPERSRIEGRDHRDQFRLKRRMMFGDDAHPIETRRLACEVTRLKHTFAQSAEHRRRVT
jgi:hypothetical protein